jgi:hypothetical protein
MLIAIQVWYSDYAAQLQRSKSGYELPILRSAVTVGERQYVDGGGGGDAPHVRRSMGHCCFDAGVPIHLRRQCIWKTCVHSPHTVYRGQRAAR